MPDQTDELGMVLTAIAGKDRDDLFWACLGLMIAHERAAAGLDDLASHPNADTMVAMLVALESLTGAPIPLPITARGEA